MALIVDYVRLWQPQDVSVTWGGPQETELGPTEQQLFEHARKTATRSMITMARAAREVSGKAVIRANNVAAWLDGLVETGKPLPDLFDFECSIPPFPTTWIEWERSATPLDGARRMGAVVLSGQSEDGNWSLVCFPFHESDKDTINIPDWVAGILLDKDGTVVLHRLELNEFMDDQMEDLWEAAEYFRQKIMLSWVYTHTLIGANQK